MSSRTGRPLRVVTALGALLLSAACSRGAEPRDTAAAAPAATMGPGANPVDTGMSATKSGMSGMSHGDSVAHDSTRRAETKGPGN